ncbi:armadillo repeat-containing protein 2 isoform X1 [Poecilia reticulata]|uniref:armadillo repeat-containing protein 2 isoform X1 n=1 Tax=Poecilia reticulata TaxID=8081 RepID=UPI0004A311FD|nr:PREDICTED: armadillo repeat-containing protein 2 isoform X1 [Poecilia reticulata]XP_008395885.1 PREDICTED: armadillo repeat-containing protein 2 isoform X1 [Poecilia reticulata]XP_008395886.1 PREDICTED: armadillo repeat-containing protein 2 isoform X1 [Poecilia reticulata]XP_017157751.1 PREDICTED: armadillo repeat-containing protein 2 isoform X1 [Poecilia reticulata]
METKHEVCSAFTPRRNSLRKSCADIVREARQSLRVQSTQRPFTPRDGPRRLFGANSVRGDHGSRPPSAFSLHARNFDADSRPGSGTRLSPLNHKPKFPDSINAEDPLKDFPKSPIELVEARKGLAWSQTRLLKSASLTSLLPSETCTDEKLNPGPEPKRLSAEQLCSPDLSTDRRGHLKASQRRTPSRSNKNIKPDVDSGVRPTESGTEQKTELGHGNGTTCPDEEDPESLVWNNVILPLLQELESIAAGSSEGSVDRLCDLCDRLHGTLADADMLGRRCKKRSGILRTLFHLVDRESAQLNLHIAKLCLALCVSGNNLLNICKLVFQISRSESNDILFEKISIIDSLLSLLKYEDVGVSGEALLYCVGALKFLSGNIAILRILLAKNCIEVVQKLLQKLCIVSDCDMTLAGNILVQLTATLRNLADHPDSRTLFVSFYVIPALCLVLRHYCEDKDICTNISRIFSKLSSYSECCLALARTPNCYSLILDLLSKHHQKQDLVVRLLFTLGNLTAKSEEPRQKLFQCNDCMPTLLRLYNSYQRRNVSSSTVVQKEAPSPREPAAAAVAALTDDVLVKLVRVLANMCIHPAVGPSLATNTTCIQLLTETLELRCVEESEDLMVNVAAAINNLSFYQEENSEIRRNQLTIAKLMLKLLLSSSMDAMLEATRVYGNLSLHKDVRDLAMQNKVHRFVVTLLDSKRAEMCFSACGVLTNLALDPPNRVCLTLEGASAKLVDCLRDFGPADWQLAGQACQALWNLIGHGSDTLLHAEERERLLEILTVYSDKEETLKWTQNEDEQDFNRACWESEFLPVAQKLIKVLHSVEVTT